MPLDDTEQQAPWEFGEIGLVVCPGLGWDEWVTLWGTVTTLHRRGLFFLGDAARLAERDLGEAYAQLMGDYASETVRVAKWVCERIEIPRRRAELSFSMHRLVAALSPAEQDDLLARAVEQKWHTADMKTAVEAQKRPRYPNNGAPDAAASPPDDEPEPEPAAEAPAAPAEQRIESDATEEGSGSKVLPAAEETAVLPPKELAAALRQYIETVRTLAPDIANGTLNPGTAAAVSAQILAAIGHAPRVGLGRYSDVLSITDDAVDLIPDAWTVFSIQAGEHVSGGRKWYVELRRARSGFALGSGPWLPAAVLEAAMAARLSDLGA